MTESLYYTLVTEGRFMRLFGSKRAEPERFCYIFVSYFRISKRTGPIRPEGVRVPMFCERLLTP